MVSPWLQDYSNYFVQGWVIASRDVVTESYTVDGLQPNVTYMFLVRAVNEEGVGSPSPVSDPVRTTGIHWMALYCKILYKRIANKLLGTDWGMKISSF